MVAGGTRCDGSFLRPGNKRPALAPGCMVPGCMVPGCRLIATTVSFTGRGYVETFGRILTQGLVLVNCVNLPPGQRKSLSSIHGSQPVFEFSDTFVIPFPEIRVEDDRSAKIDEIMRYLCDLPARRTQRWIVTRPGD